MVTILAFLFVFSLIVVIHELGHFWAARLFGVRVDAFSLGFGQTLVSVRDRTGTVWRLAAIPLGGYVKFFGDAGAASNPDTDRLTELRASIAEEHGAEAVAACYHFKPVWQRAIIAAAGPFANFVLALAIFTAAVGVLGDRGYPPIVGAVSEGSPAEAAGFAKGDVVAAINGRSIRYYADLQRFAALAGGDDAVITVERDGRPIDLDVTVGRRTTTDPIGGETTMGFIGVSLGFIPMLAEPPEGSIAADAGFAAGDRIVAVNGQPVDYFVEVQQALGDAGGGAVEFTVERDGRSVDLAPVIPAVGAGAETQEGPRQPLGLLADTSDQLLVERFGLVGAVSRGANWTWEAAAAPVRYLGRTLTGRESGRELGGVLRIGKYAGSIAEQAYDNGAASGGGFFAGLGSALGALVLLAGTLSVAIGLLNLLPIPILDGGHLVYYAYEAVAGRPLGEGAQEWGFRIGLALVLGLMIFATWNDLRYLRVFEAIGNVLS